MRAALIIDLDGVLRRWDPAIIADAERAHGLVAGALSEAAFGNADRLHAAITGQITDQQWRDAIAASLAESYGPAAARAVAQWSAACGEVDADVLELVRAQRSIRTVALLSNATDRLPDDLRRLGIDHEFDAIFGSWQLGVAKPAAQAFLRVCQQLGHPPTHCVFVDDTTAHVEAADALGMAAHHYRNVAELRTFLADPD